MKTTRKVATIVTTLITFGSLAVGANGATTYGSNGAIVSTSTHGANFLLGQSISVTQADTIGTVGINFQGTGGSAQFAVYDDSGSGGLPGALLSTTIVFDTTSLTLDPNGYAEVPFQSSFSVSSGDYWIMGVFENNIFIGETTTSQNTLTAYKSLPFGNSLPVSFGSASTYNDHTFGYYLTAIPEPSSILLIGVGAIGCVAFRRRTK